MNEPENNNVIKDCIVRIRKESGMSQKQFSDSTGIPLKTLQHWEHGDRKPPIYVIRMLEIIMKQNEAYTG